MSDDNQYCKVYLAGAGSIDACKALIADAAGTNFDRRSARTPLLDIDFFDQSKHSPENPGDAFTEWPFFLEISARDGAGDDAFLKALALLLNALERGGLRVVAACAFENELAAQRREADR